MDIYSPKWRARFMGIAWEVSEWSKDPATGVGCVIVSPDGSILATGYNGLPRGVDDLTDRLERPAKYLWTTHAEENAIANAAREGARLRGSVAFITHKPCSRCAGLLINAGVSTVVYGDGQTSMPEEEFTVALEKLDEADKLVLVA